MFYEIEFPLSALDADAVEEALLEVGASSITLVDRGDEPVLEPKPGELKLWSDTLVRALFDESHDALLATARLAERLGAHFVENARILGVTPRAWERIWLADWRPMRFGRRLWVCPALADAPQQPDAVIVRLDPGLAFGTGTHPTTALCLQMLDGSDLVGRSMIDYGCGSGILGIAALKLGAAHVICLDIDPQALIAAADNAARNGIADRLETRSGPLGLPSASCVVANILAEPLIELAPTLTAVCDFGGDLYLSGLLKTQAFAVKAAYASAFDIVQVVGRDDWCCIHARRTR